MKWHTDISSMKMIRDILKEDNGYIRFLNSQSKLKRYGICLFPLFPFFYFPYFKSSCILLSRWWHLEYSCVLMLFYTCLLSFHWGSDSQSSRVFSLFFAVFVVVGQYILDSWLWSLNNTLSWFKFRKLIDVHCTFLTGRPG